MITNLREQRVKDKGKGTEAIGKKSLDQDIFRKLNQQI